MRGVAMTPAVLLRKCPGCAGGDVAIEAPGAGRCLSCNWRCRVSDDGRVTDAIPSWRTAGRRKSRRLSQSRRVGR
jgi:hypothetical protein